MKKLIFSYLILLSFCLLKAEIVNPDPFKYINNEHISFESYEQPFLDINNKNVTVKNYQEYVRKIIYAEGKYNSNLDNTRNALLRLHFNGSYPSLSILDEDNYCYSYDTTWLDPTTVEISVPSGIYKIFTSFYIDPLFKIVALYDVDLTFGPSVHEIWIDHNEATNLIELNSYDINGVPFDLNEQYANHFIFYAIDGHYAMAYQNFHNQIMTSDILGDFQLIAGELKFDEEKIHVTQYGPIREITSNISLSNESTDYSNQQILLTIPEINVDFRIGISNLMWINNSVGSPFYWGGTFLTDWIVNNNDQWITNLYMMENVYENCGETADIILGYVVVNDFKSLFHIAPFHCIDNKIGSFWNSIPTTVDYLSPDGEQLVFGEAPIFIKAKYFYFDNLFWVGIESMGFNNELRGYDYLNSTFILTNSNGNIIDEGELKNLLGALPEDIYTLTIENNNFSLAGLSGTCILTNRFNTGLDMFTPPHINSFSIHNENNKPVNRLDHNENANLLFAVADVENIDSTYTYFPVVTDSVKVFYKLHDEVVWQEIGTDLVDEFPIYGWTYGKVFFTDLSVLTTLDSVAYDLKIHFEDDEENYTEMVLEPAFVVGDFDATSLSEDEIQKPEFILSNYPNPFNPETIIVFNLPENGDVQLDIYNIKGQKIKELVSDQLSAGQHSVNWNGEDASEKKVGSGLYLYKLIINNKTEQIKKCMLLK